MKSINNQIIDEMKRKKWLFCDYYDTLVERDCHPEDIKNFWAAEMAYQFNYSISEICFYSVRCSAEKALSEKYSGLVRVSYNYKQLCREIYDRLLYIDQENVDKKCYKFDSFYEMSLKIEIQEEQKHQFLIKERLEILKQVKQAGTKIAIISDFYIGKEGFDAYASEELIKLVDKVFISCDYGFRKDTGELYEYVLKTIPVDSKDAVMLGDNKYSDKYIPEKKGIQSFLIKKKTYKQQTINRQEKELWNLMKRNRKKAYVNYAFSLYFFIDGLYRFLKSHEVENVLFCAREGEFLRELFNLYIKEKNYEPVRNEYFYVSRLASFVPSLKNIELEKFENLFRQWKDISPQSFMMSIGFSETEAIEICNKNNIAPEEIIIDFNKSKIYEQIKKSDTFTQYYKEKSCNQKTNFMGYIDSLCPPDSDLYIIDVGWKGTIQDNIYNIYDEKRRITGVYLGITENLKFSPNNRKVGINFSTYPCVSEYFDIWSYDKSFYEKLLYASHASTIGYGNDFKPIFENFINEKETYEFVRLMQLDIMEMFKKIIKTMNNSCYSAGDLKNIYTRIHLYTICHIGNKHLKIQNRLIKGHFANFGEFSWSQKKIVGQIGEIFKSNPKEIIGKLLKEGLNIKFMYPGIKVLQRFNLTVLIPVYTRFVYLKNRKRL